MNKENPTPFVKFASGENIPLELHKVRVVQKLHLVPIERRLQAIKDSHSTLSTFYQRCLSICLPIQEPTP
ncbi:MAG: hypothetical protein ACLUKN_11995 [Bacilli bacterium]